MESEAVDNALELRKYLVQIQSRIKADITSDFTLTSVSEEQKQGVIEITTNAFESKKRFNNLKQAKNWIWNNKKGWTQEKLTDKQTKYITNNENQSFDAYMNRIFMIVTMNRNKPNNPLANALVDEARKDVEIDDQGAIEKLMEKITGKKKEEREE